NFNDGLVSSGSFVDHYNGQLRAASTAHGQVIKTAKLTGNELLNLSRQFADVGVTAAMGMSPLMILVQQGPQIADVLATASARGVNLSQALKAIAAEAWAALAPFAPLIAGAALVAGGLFAWKAAAD